MTKKELIKYLEKCGQDDSIIKTSFGPGEIINVTNVHSRLVVTLDFDPKTGDEIRTDENVIIIE